MTHPNPSAPGPWPGGSTVPTPPVPTGAPQQKRPRTGALLALGALVVAGALAVGYSLGEGGGSPADSGGSVVASDPPATTTSSPASSPSRRAPASSGHTPTEVAYLANLDDLGVYYASDESAIAAGRSVCDTLDAGVDIYEIGEVITEAGYTVREAGYIAGSAIGAFCPRYDYLTN